MRTTIVGYRKEEASGWNSKKRLSFDRISSSIYRTCQAFLTRKSPGKLWHLPPSHSLSVLSLLLGEPVGFKKQCKQGFFTDDQLRSSWHAYYLWSSGMTRVPEVLELFCQVLAPRPQREGRVYPGKRLFYHWRDSRHQGWPQESYWCSWCPPWRANPTLFPTINASTGRWRGQKKSSDQCHQKHKSIAKKKWLSVRFVVLNPMNALTGHFWTERLCRRNVATS